MAPEEIKSQLKRRYQEDVDPPLSQTGRYITDAMGVEGYRCAVRNRRPQGAREVHERRLIMRSSLAHFGVQGAAGCREPGRPGGGQPAEPRVRRRGQRRELRRLPRAHGGEWTNLFKGWLLGAPRAALSGGPAAWRAAGVRRGAPGQEALDVFRRLHARPGPVERARGLPGRGALAGTGVGFEGEMGRGEWLASRLDLGGVALPRRTTSPQVLAGANHNFLLTERRRHYLRYLGGLTFFEVRAARCRPPRAIRAPDSAASE